MTSHLPSREHKRTVAKLISLVVGLAGLAVILGWIFNITVLKSISSAWTSMKFDTAICFLLSGITLYFIARAIEGELDTAQVVISITSLIILLFMGTLFFSTLLGVHTGAEDLFINDSDTSAKTVIPGRPSVPTMINFILVALAGIVTMLGINGLQRWLKIIGCAIGIMGAVAVAGYIFNAPTLYYYILGKNSAMACHTAVLFMLLGMDLICL